MIESLKQQLDDTKKERDGYLTFERSVKKEKENSVVDEKKALQRMEQLKMQEVEAMRALRKAEEEEKALDRELAELEKEERALEEEEVEYVWLGSRFHIFPDFRSFQVLDSLFGDSSRANEAARHAHIARASAAHQ